ncbi:energy transducer TonB [candidate division WOR-3 bacterium]|nr:energy transducer TonB [candidate division WOR-3 bacterium]
MTRTLAAAGRDRIYARNLRLATVAAEMALMVGFLFVRMPAVRPLRPAPPDFLYVAPIATDPVFIPDLPQPRLRPGGVPVPGRQARPDPNGVISDDNSRVFDSLPVFVRVPETLDCRHIPAEFQPKPVHIPDPDYPELARQAGIEGIVGLEFIIGEDGRVHRPVVVLASDSPLLDRAAVAAVAEWRFIPARQQDRPVPVRARTSVRFRLR